MSFLDKIRQCNDVDFSTLTPFKVGKAQVGWIRADFLSALKAFPDIFDFADDGISLNASLNSLDSRTEAMDAVIKTLLEVGTIDRYFGETYPVTAYLFHQPLFLIDRAVASYFGTRTFGQHLNGFVRKPDGLHMWIARRAADRGLFPNRLDHLVAGGLPYNLALSENLRKECYEEAGIPAEIADIARSIGMITSCYRNERGTKPDSLYCYDLELPEDFQPVCTDGEVQEFMLLPIEEVMRLVRDTEEFKPNCNLVIIDFLIRHGVITPDEPDYALLIDGLHQ